MMQRLIRSGNDGPASCGDESPSPGGRRAGTPGPGRGHRRAFVGPPRLSQCRHAGGQGPAGDGRRRGDRVRRPRFVFGLPMVRHLWRICRRSEVHPCPRRVATLQAQPADPTGDRAGGRSPGRIPRPACPLRRREDSLRVSSRRHASLSSVRDQRRWKRVSATDLRGL